MSSEHAPGALDDDHRAFLDQPNHAVVATLDEDGRAVQSVVWFVRDGDTLWFSTRPTSAKVRHLRRDPRVSVLVLSSDGGRYMRVEGRVALDDVVRPEQRLALITKYVGAEAAPGWVAAHPLPAPNQLVRVEPTKVVSYGLS
jgi:PPOX class probable F420-dependent enzyme